jgi:hypothetical protein
MAERMAGWLRRGLTALLAGLWIATCLHAASARVIGIVFDDSGSMAPYINSPTFGVQLLLSTLDGRDGQDRVYTLRFSHLMAVLGSGDTLPGPRVGVQANNIAEWLRGARGPVVTREQLTTEALHQRAIDDIAAQWPHAGGGTPYEPIEVMLDQLVRDARPGEQAFLVILTDGELNNPPDLARVRRSYTAYRAALAAKQATLKVDFLLIAPSLPGRVALVEQQGVRPLMLEMFNGAADGSSGGRYDITDLGQMQDALKDIIARIWSTDRAQQARLITPTGNTVGFETPLSVTRIIAVGTALDPQQPPSVTQRPAGVVEERDIKSAMHQADTQPPLSGMLLRGKTTQLRFQPSLSPGRHEVGFDRAVGQDVFLLFQTAARVELSVVRPDGSPARREGSTYVLARGEPYRLEARLVDVSAGGGPAAVELSTLPHHADVSVALETPGAPQNLALQIEPGKALASGRLVADTTGAIEARAQVRLEGFVSPPSDPVRINVVDGATAFQTRIEPAEACPDCAPDEVRVTVAGDGRPRPAAQVILTPKVPLAGSATLDLSGVPKDVVLNWPDGRVIAPGAEVALEDGKDVRFALTVSRPESMPPRSAVRIRVVPREPLSGTGEVALTVHLNVPTAHLVYTSHSGGDASKPMVMSGANLTAGGLFLDFGLTDALKAPAPGEVEIASPSGLLWFPPVAVNGYTLHVEPRSSFLCLCLLALEPADRLITVRWRLPDGTQEATADARLQLALGPIEVAWSCGAIVLMIFLLIWLLLAILTTIRTRRFPRGSLAEVAERRQLSKHVDLRGRNLTFLRALLPWRAFRLASPHERTTVEGLVIEARGGGGTILVPLTTTDFRVIRLGESASEMRETNPRLERVPVIWNDEIELWQSGRIMVRLLRTMPSAAGI